MESQSKSHSKSHRFHFPSLKVISLSMFYFLLFLFPGASTSDVFQSNDNYISSILLANNQILTHSRQYLTISDPNTGLVISQERAEETISDDYHFLITWIEWSDLTIVTVYNQAIFQYNKDWTFKRSEPLDDGLISAEKKYSLILTDSSKGFLLAYINKVSKQGFICWYDSNWNIKNKVHETAISFITQVACHNYQTNNYICCYLVPSYFIQCIWYDQDLMKIEPTWNNSVKLNTDNATSIKLQQQDSNKYLLCSLGWKQIIFCNQITISSSSEIIFGTSQGVAENVTNFSKDMNYYLDKINEFEYWVTYSNSNAIYWQKIDFELNKIGSWVSFFDVEYNYTFRIFWFNGNYILLFDRSVSGFYIRWNDSINCSNYCMSTVSSYSRIKFDKVVSISKIWFMSLDFQGSFQTVSPVESVVTNKEYDIDSIEFEYVSGNNIGEERFTFVAVGSTKSDVCEGVIYNGIPFDCACPVTYYQYEGECWEECYDYLYSDTLIKRCVNCKSLGQYWYEGVCVDMSDVPEGNFVSDNEYNVIKSCAKPCKTCEITETNCLTYLPVDPNEPLVCNKGEYYDNDNKTCENCHNSCGTCSMGGSDAATNCDTCASGYISYNFNPTQCYEECNDSSNERWYIDNDRNVICVPVISCPSQYPIHVPQTNQCVDSCTTSSDCQFCTSQSSDWYIYNDTCVLTCPRNTKPNPTTWICEANSGTGIIHSKEDKNNIMDSIHKNITDYLNPSQDVIIVGNDYIVEITDSNSTSVQINFGECEILIRNYYKIPPNKNLLVVKLILNREDEWTNQVEYRIYTPWGELVDLTLCHDLKITIKCPVKEPNDLDIPLINDYLDKGIDILNSTSEFFNDICYPFTDSNNKDITLTDRQNEIYQNVSLCEDKCDYSGFNTSDLIVTCECSVKTEVSTEKAENAINAEFFKNSWNYVLNELTFEIWKCYHLLSVWDHFVGNIGFWLFVALLLLHVPLFVWMGLSGYKPIKTNMIINKDVKQGCPPKRKKYDNNEPSVTDNNAKIMENEELESSDTIEKESVHRNNKRTYTDRQDIRNRNCLITPTIKLQINETEKQSRDNPPYRDTNNEYCDNILNSNAINPRRMSSHRSYSNANNTSKFRAFPRHTSRVAQDFNDFINQVWDNEDYRSNYPQWNNKMKGDKTSQTKESFDYNIVFNSNTIHWTGSFVEDNTKCKNGGEETSQNKKSTSSFAQKKCKIVQRLGSLSSRIHMKKNAIDYSSVDRYANVPVIIVNNQSHEASFDKEKENQNGEENCIETTVIDHVIKGWDSQIKNNKPKHEVTKVNKRDSVDIKERSRNNQLSIISFESNECLTKKEPSLSRRRNSNIKRNSIKYNTATNRINTITALQTITNNDNIETQVNYGSVISSVTSSKNQSVKTKSVFSQRSKNKPLSEPKTKSHAAKNITSPSPSYDFLDDFTMEEAKMYDTRTFCMKYYVCLKAKQGLWQTFIFKAPFELKVIRIIMFLCNIGMEFAFNTVFYTDSMVSNRYHYEGSIGFWFTLQNNLIVTIISTLASWVWSALWIFLSNSNDNLKKIYDTNKAWETPGKYYIWVKQGLSSLTVKLSLFIIFEIALMIFFWYYITLFCIVFENNQIGWWQGGLMSWLIVNLIPFGLTFFIVILREIALKNKWSKIFRWSWWLYRF